MSKDYVIFAPHVDDEVIGCYQYLQKKMVREVYYFHDITTSRMKEAMMASQLFSFDPHFPPDKPKLRDTDIILVPNIADYHPHHKHVNWFAKNQFPNHKKMFYSVDMNVPFEVLMEGQQVSKKEILMSLYPSQRSLFEADAKYYLFESALRSDDRKMIWVTFHKEGIHAYPAALTDPNLEDVKFLGYPHRHIFQFKVAIEVTHDDRDIEFIQFKRWLEGLYTGGTLQLDHKSCEMIADELSAKIRKQYPHRKMKIEVSEDGENGTVIEYEV